MSEQETPLWDPNKFYEQAEPESQEPTEEANNQPDEPEQEEEQPQLEDRDENFEAEEEESEESEPQLSDDEQYVPLDTKEGKSRDVSLKEIKEWEKGYLRQSDYTKKTQKLARERDAFEANKDAEVEKVLAQRLEGFDDKIAELEVLIQQADDAIDWDDLRSYDIGEYTKQKELKEKRIQAVADAKVVRAKQDKVELTPEDQQKVQAQLLANNPEWVKDGEQTEAHKKDMELLSGYLVDSGYTIQEQEKIVTARHWQTLIDAARYRDSLKRVQSVKKKVKKVPLTVKPKKTSVKPKLTFADKFYS